MSSKPFQNDEYFMELALKLAKVGMKAGEVPVGSLVVDESGKIIAMAYNKPVKSSDPTAHAEILAIRRAAKRIGNYRLIGCTLYSTLEPCPMCYGAMVHARIERLVFGADDPQRGALSSGLDLTNMGIFNHYIKLRGGVLSEECKRLLLEFFYKKRRGTEVVVTGSTRNRLVR